MRAAIIATALCMTAIQSRSMPVRQALGLIESGGDDKALGKAGEVSRYQIKPAVWQCFSKCTDYQNERIAWQVAFKVIEARSHGFLASHKRQPNAFEVYVLWNAPAQIDNPSAAVKERATRFVNLINRK
jgi:hypothetical protein